MADVRVVFLSTFPPSACGLATFTENLVNSVDEALDERTSLVAAIRKDPRTRYKDRRVHAIIDNSEAGAYEHAGRVLSDSAAEVVCVQHEFGLYPGDWGDAVLDLVRACRKPLVTTLHTLATNPDPKARQIVRHLTHASDAMVVMSKVSRHLLKTAYGLPGVRPMVIPHGVPDVQFVHRATLRHDRDLHGRPVLFTFGLLSRSKRIEVAIDALPRILNAFPNALYVVAGQTHPNVLAEEGESYREELRNRAERLGVGHAVRFINRYFGKRELIDLIQTADVYVIPYGGREQVVSGTLAYAMGCGRAIVSTPFLYAAEVLGGGRGILFGFEDAAGLAAAAIHLLRFPALREELEAKAYAYARRMIWHAVGSRYAALFRRVAGIRQEPAPARIDTPDRWLGRRP